MRRKDESQKDFERHETPTERRLKDKLQELIDTIEWLDECKHFESYCLGMTDWLPVTWDPIYARARDHLVQAENDYQAALRTAKKE